MRHIKHVALALAVAAFSGCTGEGINRAEVFKKQGGSIDLNVSNLPDPSAYTSVDFELDGQPLGKDEDASDGWSFKLDSTTLSNGIHTVRALGNTPAGTQVELLNNSLYIDNAGGSAPAPAESPAAGNGTDTEGETPAEPEPTAFRR
jgi:Bacterial Ig domain